MKTRTSRYGEFKLNCGLPKGISISSLHITIEPIFKKLIIDEHDVFFNISCS